MNESDNLQTPPSDSVSQSLSDRPTIRGVALDMDGLLFDTERLYWEVGDAVLVARGHRYSHELQQRMMGRIGVAAMQQMIDFHGLSDSPEDLLAESDRLYSEKLAHDITAMPGLDSWIGVLRSRKVPFGLATSSRRKFVDIILATTDWAGDLAFVLTGDDVTHGKPHPEMYLRAAEKLTLPPTEMLVLEDSQNGCAAAVAARAYTVAIPSEHTKTQSFDGAKLIADSLTDPRLWALV